MKSLFSILSLIIVLTGCKKDFEDPDYYPSPPSSYLVETAQYNSISGVETNLLSLDIYHFGESSPSKPVVVWVHGGGWRRGDKSERLNNKLHLCSEMGYIFVSVNYRLSPYPGSSDPNSIRYPTHNNDVADAVKWVYDSIEKYGGDKEKMVLLGHSAGAQIVSLTGTCNLFLPKRGIPLSAIKGIASIDTEGYDVSQRIEEADLDLYRNAFGTDPKVLFEASPINHLFLGTSYPRFFITKRGSAKKTANSLAFIDKLQTIGASVSVVDGSQYDHNGINRAIGAPNETAVTDPFKSFLIECFR
jgi:arylformamidase